MSYYKEELIDPLAIINWFHSVGNIKKEDRIRDLSKPFVDWLEEEESSSSSDSSDEEIDFSETNVGDEVDTDNELEENLSIPTDDDEYLEMMEPELRNSTLFFDEDPISCERTSSLASDSSRKKVTFVC